MTLEDIGEGGDALLCMIEQPVCCQYLYTGAIDDDRGNWYFPNGTRINSSGDSLDFNRTRDQIVVHLNRRQVRVPGIYRCEIPNELNVTQNIYIGVYNASTGELALSPGPSQILSRSRGEKPGEGLGAKLRHGPKMMDSVST